MIIVDSIRKWAKIVGQLPMENQILRKENARLANACQRLQSERDQWQRLHQAAGVGYQASQDIMMQEIVRLSRLQGVEPDAKFGAIVNAYAEAHVAPHAAKVTDTPK